MALRPGFADPVLDGQGVFRAVMDALARPGLPRRLPAALDPPPPLTPELAAIALALADADAPLWLDGTLAASPEAAAYLRFHTGARIVRDPENAVFALVADPAAMPALAAFAQGTDTYPDRSTTLVVAVASLDGGTGVTLDGPGIRGTATFGPEPIPVGFATALRANHALFPCGVDCLFVSAGRVAAIPRSSRILEAA